LAHKLLYNFISSIVKMNVRDNNLHIRNSFKKRITTMKTNKGFTLI